jgi:hypothetical protein
MATLDRLITRMEYNHIRFMQMPNPRTRCAMEDEIVIADTTGIKPRLGIRALLMYDDPGAPVNQNWCPHYYTVCASSAAHQTTSRSFPALSSPLFLSFRYGSSR